jgi:hydrogenase maturation protein HypF
MAGAAPVRHRIRVVGTVQGVGFRPFVYRRAVGLGLGGWVRNDSEGVLIEVEGDERAVLELERTLLEDPPPLARVGVVTAAAIPPSGVGAFAIVETDASGPPTAPVSVDTATCPACLAEIDDPADRRYRYPFTNCTDCGPRYTIVRSVPYDRPATTMAGFTMCPSCQAEYDDPADRRFHAQPNACPACGPRLRWTPVAAAGGDAAIVGEDALDAAIVLLRAGGIVAVKGIGGFHLAVVADDERAVGELRRRKRRDDKPFAVMVGDPSEVARLVEASPGALAVLGSPGRPIVIAPRREGAPVAPGVAPGLPDLGILLAYSPLHHLLLRGVGRPLVMTSGNLSDEPIAHDDDDAVTRLGPLVDGVLGHDRGIHVRCDDSVVRDSGDGLVQVLRRSRGLAPEPIPLVRATRPGILAVGAGMKSTVAVTRGGQVVASHHIGDLEHLASYRSFTQAVDHLLHLYGVTPEVVAHDLHPEYLSSKWAAGLDLPAVEVQHHHAHLASCLTEHGRPGPVLGLAFDGIGFGPDGTLWGGEILVGDLCGCERVGHLAAVTLPGGVAAIREPWRMGVAWAARAGVDVPFDDPRLEAVAELAARGRGPVTTSMGRLFDAVASLAGMRPAVSYEAQAAIELEAAARPVSRAVAPVYPVEVGRDAAGMVVIDPSPLVAALVRDRASGTSPALLAAGFHDSIGRAAAEAAARAAGEQGLETVVLTGGVFSNRRLSDRVADGLRAAGLEVLEHRRVPPNDGGISIGQAAVAAARS